MAISYSKVNSYYSCPYGYHLSYKKKIKRIRKPRALFLGSVIHKLLEMQDNREDWLSELKKINNDLTAEDKESIGEEDILYLKDTIQAYISRFGCDSPYEIIETEMKLECTIDGMKYIGYVDAVVKQEDKYYILERKTSSSAFPGEATLVMKEQPYIYAKLVGKKLGVEIHGIVWEYITSKPLSVVKVKKDGEPYKNSLTVTPFMWAKYCAEQGVLIDTPETCTYDNAIQRTVVLLDKDKINFMFKNFVEKARNINENSTVRLYDSVKCTRFCEFSEYCQHELRGLDTDVLMGTIFKNKE